MLSYRIKCDLYLAESLLALAVGLFICSFSTSSITELNRLSILMYKLGLIGFSTLRFVWKWALLFSSSFCFL